MVPPDSSLRMRKPVSNPALVLGAGVLICLCRTSTGLAQEAARQDAQRHWKAAQTSLNRVLGVPRLLTLHTLIDEALDLLAPTTSADRDE